MARAISVLLFLCMAAASAVLGLRFLPPEWNPWKPLDFAAPINFVTRFKLARIEADPALCDATIARAPRKSVAVSPMSGEGGCSVPNPWRVDSSKSAGIALSGGFVASCPLAVSFALFEAQAVAPAARDILGQDVVRIDHVGSYACRNVNHQVRGRLSQHAHANAVDITGFNLADGTKISVDRTWDDSGPKGVFLRAVHDRACRVFDGVLGPDYNALHKTHFHFDMGPYWMCR